MTEPISVIASVSLIRAKVINALHSVDGPSFANRCRVGRNFNLQRLSRKAGAALSACDFSGRPTAP